MTDIYEDEITEDLEEDAFERQQDLLEDSSPTYKGKDDLYSLFWKVIRVLDSSKVGNLDKVELGSLNISVRDCQKIALLAESLGHQGFANFFWKQAQIILRTSSSKKGWLADLFVSQKKFQTKARGELGSSEIPVTQETVKKKTLFGKR